MFSRIAHALASFQKREDGLTKVEYGVMLGLLSVGCLVALTLGGTNGKKNRDSFTVNFGGRWNWSGPAEGWRPRGLKDGASKDAKDELALVSTEGENNKVATRGSGTRLSEGDARHALAGLVKADPGSFSVSKEAIQSLPIVRKADHMEIGPFHCYLHTKWFVYRPSDGAGQAGVERTGVFSQLENGEWFGKITAAARR